LLFFVFKINKNNKGADSFSFTHVYQLQNWTLPHYVLALVNPRYHLLHFVFLSIEPRPLVAKIVILLVFNYLSFQWREHTYRRPLGTFHNRTWY